MKNIAQRAMELKALINRIAEIRNQTPEQVAKQMSKNVDKVIQKHKDNEKDKILKSEQSVIFNYDKVKINKAKTKEQLTDIWSQAHNETAQTNNNSIRYPLGGGTVDVSGLIEPKPLADKYKDLKGKWLDVKSENDFKADVERTNEKIKEAYKNAKPLSEKWRGIKGKWLGDRFEEDFKADVERNNNIDKIRKAYKKHKPEGAKSWRDLDLALELYMNLKVHPEHIKEFGPKLKDEQQKRILKLSQNLPPKMKKLAIEMQSDYKILGEKVLDAGVNHNLLEFYLPQVWDMPKNMTASEFMKKFTLTNSHAKYRVLGSILEGWAKGLNLKVEGAAVNMAILKKSINHVIENKQLIQDGLKTKGYGGKNLFITHTSDGYKQIKNPGFVHWEKVEKMETPSKKKLKNNDFVVTKDGAVLLKQKIYAPKPIAKELNNILEDPYKINLLHKLKRKMNLASINFNYKPMKIKKVVAILAILVLVFYIFMNVYLSTFIGAQYNDRNGKGRVVFLDKYYKYKLTVVDYSIWHQTFTLSNGKKVHFLLLSTLKKVK